MKSYDPPGETFGLTAEQAQAAVHKMHADVLADKDHPFFNGGHPQHADFVDYNTKLHRIIIESEAEEKDAAAAEKLAAARAVTGDLPPAECMAHGRALLKTKGYLVDDGTMSSEARAELKRQIDAAFLVGCQEPETSPLEEMETDADE